MPRVTRATVAATATPVPAANTTVPIGIGTDPIAILILVAQNGYAPTINAGVASLSRDPDLWSCLARVKMGAKRTWLHAASDLGHTNRVRFLCDVGTAMLEVRDASVHASSGRNTALNRAAARLGNVEVVRTLLDRGAIVNTKAKCGTTPLRGACISISLPVVRLLVERGARVVEEKRSTAGGVITMDGESLAESDDEDDDYDLDGDDESDGDESDDDDVTVEEDEGTFEYGQTPLHSVCQLEDDDDLECGPPSDRLEIAALLVAHGADLEAIDREGNTPLTSAASHFSNHAVSSELVDLLLSKGACIQPVGGNSALHLAVTCGDAAAVLFLLKRGASPNFVDAEGSTALHDCVSDCTNDRGEVTRAIACATALLDHGADVNALGRLDATSLELAVDRKYARLAGLLKKRGGVVLL